MKKPIDPKNKFRMTEGERISMSPWSFFVNQRIITLANLIFTNPKPSGADLLKAL
jgi:hypothetical protein